MDLSNRYYSAAIYSSTGSLPGQVGVVGAREESKYRSEHEHDNILIFSGMKYELETRK